MDLKKRVGPLPLWAWTLVVGVVGFYLYRRYTENQTATTSSTSPTASTLDPNAIDPNTGLTYGQEEDAAYQQMATSGSSGGSYSGSTPTTLTGSQELQDFESFIASMQGAGLFPSTSTPSSSTPPTATAPNITVNVPASPAAAAAPVSSTPGVPGSASSPAAAPAVNVNTTLSPSALSAALLTTAGVAGSQAQTFLSGLLSGGYRKLSGSTQAGGLTQTGTYTRAGGPTYFVWGTSTTGLHIRQAVSTPSTSGGSINRPGVPTPAGGFRP